MEQRPSLTLLFLPAITIISNYYPHKDKKHFYFFMNVAPPPSNPVSSHSHLAFNEVPHEHSRWFTGSEMLPDL